MNELTKTNQNLTKKEALGQYVHDMVDLEIRAFSLRKMAEQTRKEAERAEKNATWRLENAKKELEKTESYVRELEEQGISNGRPIKKVVIAFFISILPAILLGCGIWEMVDEQLGWSVGVMIPIFTWFVTLAITINREEHKLRQRISLWETQCQGEKAKYDSVEIDKYNKTIHYTQTLCSHADQLDKDIAEIETTLQKNYALKIIPPDYRRLECLVWIDYAFRNDQVDTMREATLQCDKWVRHTDTMKALKELAENIRSIAVLLENMDSNISMMNQDLFRIAEAQEKQLSESQSARYAMESVQKSTERLAMYEDMKRAGTF